MQRGNCLKLFVLGVLLLGVSVLAGCAARSEPLPTVVGTPSPAAQAEDTAPDAADAFLEAEEPRELATERLQRAMKAYHDKDYIAAEGLFEQAAALEEHLADWRRRALRERLGEVRGKLAELRGHYAGGKRLRSQMDFAGAVERLQIVVDSGISIGAEQDQDVAMLLRGAKEKLAEEQRKEEESKLAGQRLRDQQARTEHLAALLAEAGKLVAQKRYEEAEAKLAELTGASEELGDGQREELQRLRSAFERVAGRLPGMTEEEARELAAGYLRRAVEAQEAGQYFAAEGLFERAVALEEHLDPEGRLALRTARADVTQKLAAVRADYEEGKRLYALQDFAGAAEHLQKVADTGISIGAEQDDEAAMLLRGSKARLGEDRRRELEAQFAEMRDRAAKAEKERLTALLAGTKALVARGEYAEAAPKLADLARGRLLLTEPQRDEMQLLREEVERTTGRLPGMTTPEARELASSYLERAIEAQRANDYLSAERLFVRAAALEKYLTEAARRVFRTRHPQVTETLAELRTAYSEGTRLHGEQDYPGAFPHLQKMVDSNVSIGAQEGREAIRLLRDCKERMPMVIASPAFGPGEAIPVDYTEDGENISPPLVWDYVPKGTVSFALIMDDPDASMYVFTHWLIAEMNANVRGLPAGVPTGDGLLAGKTGAVQGVNGFRKIGYGGPAPPKGKTHRYYFRLYALDERLDLSGRYLRSHLRAAMKDHILGEAELMGTYGR